MFDLLIYMFENYLSSKNNLDFANMKIKLDIEHGPVSALRKILLTKIEVESVKDKETVFRKRMSRLMNHNIRLSLKADKCLEGIIQDRISFFINAMTSIARENAIDSSSVLSQDNPGILPQYLPYFSTKRAIKKATSDSRFILNTGMVITIDNG